MAAICLAASLALAGCASGPRGGDGAPSSPPGGLAQLADAEPRVEPIRGSGGTSKPYTVLGQSYVPITDDRAFRESGLASWYGTKFHAQATASGEPYDMYAMTAAHKTLPLPSYVRVRNPANGREAIVRVNDRGPFHAGRVIDLSYAAASKLDLLRGVAPVEIERITNADIRAGTWRRDGDGGALAMAAAAPAPAQQAPIATVNAGTAVQAPVPLADTSVAVPAAWTAPVVATAVPEAAALPALAAATRLPSLPPQSPPTAVDAGGLSGGQPPAAAPAPGFWVQLGAFSQREGAAGLRERAARSVPTVGPMLNVFGERGVYRVQAGPYASREAAGGTAEQLRLALQLAPIVVERR